MLACRWPQHSGLTPGHTAHLTHLSSPPHPRPGHLPPAPGAGEPGQQDFGELTTPRDVHDSTLLYCRMLVVVISVLLPCPSYDLNLILDIYNRRKHSACKPRPCLWFQGLAGGLGRVLLG